MRESSSFRLPFTRFESRGNRQHVRPARFGLCGERLESRRVLAGVEFEEHLISEEEYRVRAADVDGDNDLDVISFAWSSEIFPTVWPSQFSWHENLGGIFGEARGLTSTDPRSIFSVFPADVDGDADIDVIVGTMEQRILWYENTDGMGTFGTGRLIGGTSGLGPKTINGTDVDGDGDVDVLSGSGGVFRWYENMDGNGNFRLAQLIPRWSSTDWAVHAADLDGDGDVDALSSKWSGDGVIAWHENTDGAGNFGSPNVIVSTHRERFWSLDAVDLDGDGDLDVISSSESFVPDLSEHRIAWYRNDGAGTFRRQKTIATFEDSAVCVDAADMDGDGDNDVLSATWDRAGGHGIAWHENIDGAGTFGPSQDITDDGGWCVEAADLDGDDDSDILSSSIWYENLTDTNLPQPGDANEDRQFNQLDLVRVFQSGKYLTGEPANFNEGDWSNDGVFNQLDVAIALATGNYLQGPYAAGASSLDQVLAANENVNEQVADDALIGDLARMRIG